MEFKLIIKKLNNTLTSQEEIIFSKWYNESDLHKDYFYSVKNNYKVGLNDIDIKKAWLELQSNLKVQKERNNYWKYGIAVSVLLLISIGFIFNSKDTTKIENSVIADVDNVIQIGTDKAILTLEDGSVIPLEKGKTYASDNLKSNGEELIYDAKNVAETELVYNYLTIPRGGEFFIKLSDGTEVWLNSESQLKYPVMFREGETRQVELVYGEAYFNVSPSIKNKGAKFIVLNKNQEVEVLGTEFNIKAYKEEVNIYTALVEGKVTVRNSVSKEFLLPNQQSIININNSTISICEVDIYS